MRINRSSHVGMLLVQALMPGALFLFGGLVRRLLGTLKPGIGTDPHSTSISAHRVLNWSAFAY